MTEMFTDLVTQSVGRLSNRLFRMVLRIVGNRDDALDVLQDTFIRVLSNRSRIRHSQKIPAYLFKAAYNLALNLRRDRARGIGAARRLFEDQALTSNPGTGDVESSNRQQSALSGALASLPDRQKEAVSLKFYGEMTFAEVAQAMNIAEGSAKVHVARGLQNLRVALVEKL
jgi:RNA polymerase sigma factor (sigma-70 family)